ncbi:hypothetical protein [Streptomyces dysideae]|uniref:Uncharacterized protein n=1 Tax=Streptomyces dysideae TaxID=909626 RepID=A0A101UP65_9ACTN|nr:hypothetical protein [Streptomyces dysideae]KUO14371.1 hypothetical protein AQJ91_47130 [Streptomyces dysideae]
MRGSPLDVTLVSDSNFLLFTPMPASVVSGTLEPAHISVPVRAAAQRTRIRHGRVESVDTDARVARLDAPAGVSGRSRTTIWCS